MFILPMLLGSFRPPKPESKIFLRYARDGSPVHLFMHCNQLASQVCARSMNSEFVVPVRLSFFPRRQPLSFFPCTATECKCSRGRSKMLAVLVLGRRERLWRVPQVRASEVEKLRTVWVG
jgi:hypothetical protein